MEGAHPPMLAGEPSSGAADGRGRDRCFYDSAPLLRHQRLLRQPTGAAAAAPGMEERQIEWGYSRPLVALDLVWSVAFVLVSCSVLVATARERPSTPIRVWILGYALHCLIHVCFVCFEYRRRQSERRGRDRWAEAEAGDWGEEEEGSEETRQSRVMKRLESTNAVISFFWWMVGLYWIVAGGQTLMQDAPRLYWLTVVFLAFDVFFAVFCAILACVVGVALCCCLPCIVAVVYSVSGQDGVSDALLDSLPRFSFRFSNAADSDCCCICLCRYEDGAELCSLPCGHHFHSCCIVTWLRMNATCPLCKLSIVNEEPV